jgi:IS30 family transposase
MDILWATNHAARTLTSWQRGSNESFNVLIREYMPKKRLTVNVTGGGIKMIETG